jgi:ariadne-1
MKSEFASILLRYFKWNKEKLIETYMENDVQVTEEAGLPLKEDPKVHRILMKVPGFSCDICCSDEVRSHNLI